MGMIMIDNFTFALLLCNWNFFKALWDITNKTVLRKVYCYAKLNWQINLYWNTLSIKAVKSIAQFRQNNDFIATWNYINLNTNKRYQKLIFKTGSHNWNLYSITKKRKTCLLVEAKKPWGKGILNLINYHIVH